MRTPALAAFLALVLASVAAAQEKVKLEVRAAKGDRITRTLSKSNEGKVTFMPEGQEIPRDVRETEVRKFADEVLEVQGTLPSKVRRRHTEWYKSAALPGEAEPLKTPYQLEGKTILLRREGDRTVHEDAAGIPEDELRKNHLRIEGFLAGLPAEPVAVGASWPIDSKIMKEEFEESEQGVSVLSLKGTGTLEKIEDHKGVRCGVLSVDLSWQTTFNEQKGILVDLKLRVRVWLALESGRPLTLKGEGASTASGEVEEGGQKVPLKGSFTLKIEGENRYE